MTTPVEEIKVITPNDSEPLVSDTSDLQKKLNDAKATIAVLVRNVVDLKTLGESAMATMEREAVKRAELEAELEKAKQRASKDKEGLVRQVENLRAQILRSKTFARILDNKDFFRYWEADGRPNEKVPADIRREKDWIGALIKAFNELDERKRLGEWGGILEAHINAEAKDLPPKGECACPVCVLRWNVQAMIDEQVAKDKKIKDLTEENRCHRREHGPQAKKK